MKRFFQNLTTGTWHVRRHLGAQGAARITEAVKVAEQTTSAQIKVVIEAALDLAPLLRGQTANDRALEVFGHERVWDTSSNNGILLYLLVAERDAEIVADRGFNDLVTAKEWSEICDTLSREVLANDFVTGIIRAVEMIGAVATRIFPSTRHSNEISDTVSVRR